jgi:hypothetical protein
MASWFTASLAIAVIGSDQAAKPLGRTASDTFADLRVG